MPYKTIILGLIEQQTELHERLCQSRTLLRTMDQMAIELKESHGSWIARLRHSRPGRDPIQIASEAMEFAVAELEERLASVLPTGDEEPLSLDGAMAY